MQELSKGVITISCRVSGHLVEWDKLSCIAIANSVMTISFGGVRSCTEVNKQGGEIQ